MKLLLRVAWWVRTACWVSVPAFALVTAVVNPVGAQEAVAVVEQVGAYTDVSVLQNQTLNDATVLQGFPSGECNGCGLNLGQIGDDDISYLARDGIDLVQDGVDNYFIANQEGELNKIRTLQYGIGNSLNIDQFNSGNFAVIYQYGDRHRISVLQPGGGFIEITQE